MNRTWRALAPALALVVLGSVEALQAQRGGGRRQPEAVRTRSGSYFVNVKLPEPDEKSADRLAASSAVRAAAERGELVLLYVYDPDADKRKHAMFEQTLFGNQAVSVALRCFRCGRINLADDHEAKTAFGKKAPYFVAFDAKGKRAGEVSMHGYKASTGGLVKILDRAHKGHAKLSLGAFGKKYRSFLRDLLQLEGKKRLLTDKRQRLEGKRGKDGQLKKIEQEERSVAAAETKLFEDEKKLLDLAKVPPRAENAERLGDRPWGRGR